MSFVDKLLSKDKPVEYFLTLKIGISSLYAAVWEVKNNKIIIIGRGEAAFDETGDNIEASDKAISDAEKNLPQGQLVEKVIFGLPPDFTHNDKIKPEILSQLKKLTQRLSLTPLGFIELPQALAHYLLTKEDSPTSLLLLGVNKKTITITRLRVGKIVENATFDRSENFGADTEKAIKGLTTAEILPSRILIYGEDENLEKLQEELIKYPWRSKSAFLHFPKIEIIQKEEMINALVESGASEIIKSVSAEEFKGWAETSAKPQTIPIDTKEEQAEEEAEQTNELNQEAASMGFFQNKDVRLEAKDEAEETVEEEPERKKSHVLSKEEPLKRQLNLPNIKLPNFRLPSFGKLKFLPIVIILLLVLTGGAISYAYFQVPKADIKLLVAAKNMPKDVDITLSPNSSAVDKDNMIIPASSIDTEINGDKTASASGKKNIGNPAKGTVTVYNKTTDGKTLPKGTVLSANNLKFTLDSDATIASASDTGEGLTYGKTDSKITASAIGPESNLADGTSFTFADFPSTSYSAKSSGNLSGGTSRQVSAVSKADQDNLLDALASELKDKAKSALYQKLGSDEKILDGTLQVNLLNKKFDKSVGDEASSLSLSLDAKISAFSYKTSDLNTLVKNTMVNNTPAGFEFSPENTNLKVNSTKPQKDGSLKISATITVKLLPKIALDKIQKDIAGMSLAKAQDYLKNTGNINVAEFNIDSPFPFGRGSLPRKSSNIHLTIATD